MAPRARLRERDELDRPPQRSPSPMRAHLVAEERRHAPRHLVHPVHRDPRERRVFDVRDATAVVDVVPHARGVRRVHASASPLRVVREVERAPVVLALVDLLVLRLRPRGGGGGARGGRLPRRHRDGAARGPRARRAERC
eukprot:31022-Pelagococcus_subviridis.AAC.1